MMKCKKSLLKVLHLAECQLQRSFQCTLDELSPPKDVQCDLDQFQAPTANLISAIFSHRKVVAAIMQHLQGNFCTIPRKYKPLCQLLIFLLVFGLESVPVDVLRRFIVRHPLSSSGSVHCIFEMVTSDVDRLSKVLERFYDSIYVKENMIDAIVRFRPELSAILLKLRDEENHANEPEQPLNSSAKSSLKTESFIDSQRTRLPPFVDLSIPLPSFDKRSELRSKRDRKPATHDPLKHPEETDTDRLAPLEGEHRRRYSEILSHHLHGQDKVLLKTKMYQNERPFNLRMNKTTVSETAEGSTKQKRLQVLNEIRQQRQNEIQRKRKQIAKHHQEYADGRKVLDALKSRRFDPTMPSQNGEGLPQMTYFELQQKAQLQKQFNALYASHQHELIQRKRRAKLPQQ